MKRKFLQVLFVLVLAFVLIGVGKTAKVSSVSTKDGKEQETKEDYRQEIPPNENENEEEQKENEEEKSGVIGVILSGDETESATLAQIDGILAAADSAQISTDEIVWKERVAEDECGDTVKKLIKNGCELVIACSGAYENTLKDLAESYPEVVFVETDTEVSEQEELSNFYGVRMRTYEADYVAGVAAGMKLKQLVKEEALSEKNYDTKGNLKIGYVAAENTGSVRAGIYAYFEGVKQIYADTVMQVEYIGTRNNSDAEATAAGDLIREGCVILASNTDLDATMQMAEDANQSGKCVYAVGRNTDMRKTAEHAVITSVENLWSVYYTKLFEAKLNNEDLSQNWSGGYTESAVKITALGENAAPGTLEKIRRLQKKMKSGQKKITGFSVQTLEGITEAEKNNVD